MGESKNRASPRGLGLTAPALRVRPGIGPGLPRSVSRSSAYGYVAAGLAVLVLLGAWSLGVAGCTARGSGYGRMEVTPGAFPTLRLSSGEISRLERTAHYYALMGRPELGLMEMEQALQQNPDNLQIVNLLAQHYEDQGKFEAARQLYQEALTRHGDNPVLANNLGFSYYREGRWQEAEICFRQTLARDPQNKAARNNLGLLYCRLGRQDEARRLWQETGDAAAADAMVSQALAALGMSDRAVYARRPAPASSVAGAPLASTSQAAVSGSHAPLLAEVRTPAQPVAPKEPVRPVAAKPAAPAPVAARPQPEARQQAAMTRPAPPAARLTPAPVAAAAAAVAPVAAPIPAEKPTPAQPVAPKEPARQVAAKPVAPTPAPVEVKPAAPVPVAAKPQLAIAAATPAPAPQAAPPPGPAPLISAELVGSAIEVRNGTRAKNLAHQTRSLLREQGFTVAFIGNHVDFGAASTMVYYRPGAEKVAQAVARSLFPGAGLASSQKIKKGMNIKVLLGHDLLENPQFMARLNQGAPAAAPVAAAPPAADKLKAARTGAEPPAARREPLKVKPAKAGPAPPPQPPESEAIVALHPTSPAPPFLTCEELVNTAIEVRNGTWTKNLAHETRSLLREQGFTVAFIGNHVDFGAATTIIYYRPGAEKVAQAVAHTVFPGAELAPSQKIKRGMDIKILLGADLLQRPQLMARLVAEGK